MKKVIQRARDSASIRHRDKVNLATAGPSYIDGLGNFEVSTIKVPYSENRADHRATAILRRRALEHLSESPEEAVEAVVFWC